MTLVDNEMTLADIWSSPECTHTSIISQNPPLKVEVWYNLVEGGSMKTWKKTRGMLACASLAMVCGARGVETKCLDGMWEFAFAEGKSLAEAKADFKATDMMPVPGCYDLVPDYYMKRGTGLYRREFTLARDVPGARVRVKGMGLRMKLWLDGREIGTSKLVFSDLEFQTGPLAAGRHTLAAALDNRLFNANNEMFQPYYDYVASGGFYHGVELRLQQLPVEIDRVLVRNRDYKTGRVELELCVRNAADGTSAADAVREAQVSFDGGAPATSRRRWSTRSIRRTPGGRSRMPRVGT